MTDQALAKIRKLLAKAEDPAATAEEAETYNAKAAALVAQYGIDRALLAEREPSSDVVGDRVVVLDPPYALDKADLLAGVALALRCRCVQRVRYVDGAKQLSMHLFGYGSDLFRVELLFTSLLMQATSQLTRTPVPPGESTAAYRRSWLAGFSRAVGRRLREAERAAQDAAESSRTAQAGREGATTGGAAGSVALVLADRDAAVSEALSAEYPRLRRAQERQLSGSGGWSGYAAGQRADLGSGSRLHRGAPGELAG